MNNLKFNNLMVNGVEIYHNAKEVIYPNGYTKLKVANKPIYRENGYEKSMCYNSETEKVSKPQAKGNEPREDSVKRAKQKIFDIIMLNEFKYFVTFTFNGEKINRTNEKEILKKVSHYLKNRVQRQGFKYILVPEYHKDGEAIHIHALISGDLKLVDSGTRLVKGHKKSLKISTMQRLHIPLENGRIVYNMSDWSYGFSEVVEIYGQTENCAKYITKYITKDVKKIFGKFYLSGGSLIRNPEQVIFDVDYESIEAKEYECQATHTKFKFVDYKTERNDKK